MLIAINDLKNNLNVRNLFYDLLYKSLGGNKMRVKLFFCFIFVFIFLFFHIILN